MVKLLNKNSAIAAVLLIVVAAIFLGIDAAIKTVDVNAVPDPFKAFFSALQIIFGLPVTVFVVALIRNFYGFYRAEIQAELNSQPNVQYDFNKLGRTVGLYITVGIGAFATLPAPWNNIAVAATFIIDIIQTEVAYLFKKPKK